MMMDGIKTIPIHDRGDGTVTNHLAMTPLHSNTIEFNDDSSPQQGEGSLNLETQIPTPRNVKKPLTQDGDV